MGLSGTAVAKEVGVAQNYIYDIESARKKPSLDLVFKLAGVYKDGSLIAEFIKHNRMFDGDFDFMYEVFARIPYEELKKRLHYVQRIYAVIDNNEEAKSEIVELLKGFLSKYEKPFAILQRRAFFTYHPSPNRSADAFSFFSSCSGLSSSTLTNA